MRGRECDSVDKSWFGAGAHRWPDAARQLGYAMACVEVVLENSPRAADLYNELLETWAAPELRSFYEAVMAEASAEEVEDLKEKFRHPELVMGSNPNNVFEEFATWFKGEPFDPRDDGGQVPENIDSDPQASALANWLGLMTLFILEGFNRQEDVERGIYRVVPKSEPPWLLLAVLYRSGLEHGGISLERLRRIYKVRHVKGKQVHFEAVMHKEPTSRAHRRVVKASKKANLKLKHDQTFLDAAWLWYQCRVVHGSVEKYIDAESHKGDCIPDLKNVQQVVKTCDEAIGYQKRMRKLPR